MLYCFRKPRWWPNLGCSAMIEKLDRRGVQNGHEPRARAPKRQSRRPTLLASSMPCAALHKLLWHGLHHGLSAARAFPAACMRRAPLRSQHASWPAGAAPPCSRSPPAPPPPPTCPASSPNPSPPYPMRDRAAPWERVAQACVPHYRRMFRDGRLHPARVLYSSCAGQGPTTLVVQCGIWTSLPHTSCPLPEQNVSEF
jgi:hypothetical protein